MIPILYSPAETAFDNNGVGMLTDTIQISAPQQLNGMCEITIKYPAQGRYASEIRDRSIILVAPDPITRPQPYKVYRINPVSAGTITAYARHLAYDLSGVIAAPFSAGSAADAMTALKQAATSSCPFSFETDKNVGTPFSYPKPRNMWRTLGGSEGSLLDIYGGEYEFDRYTVRLLTRRGQDRDVEIRYGKNLRTVEMDRNCAEVYTGCYPFWYSDEGGLVEAPDRIIPAEGTYDFTRIYELDLSNKWQDKPTPEAIADEARRWMAANDIGKPKISWKIEFVQLEQTEEYKGKALLEQVLLGDTVHVIFPEMDVDVSARVVTIDYDPINERYNSITLGRVRQNLADTIIHQNGEIHKKPGKGEISSLVTAISQRLGDALTGALGGAVRQLDTDGDGFPDELYIGDSPNPSQAKKVWRLNYEGWAASRHGYSGPWEFGATLEDGLLAAAVTAAHLKTGTIESKDGSFFCDLDNGIFRFKPISDLEADVQDKYDQIAKILRLTDRGILVGEDGSNTELRLDHDVIEILVSGLAAMAIDHSGLFADQITVREIHQGPFTWTVDGNVLTLT